MSNNWTWEKTDPNRSAPSGDLAKLFRHEEPKRPGILEANAPSAAATLMAREVIQNSWDAARELRQTDPGAPQFQLEFRFMSLAGEAKQAFAKTLRLDSHAARIGAVKEGRKHLGLQPIDCLEHLEDANEPLQMLQIVESATTGMYGSWAEAKSRMYWALVSLGYTVKGAGSGGSYGYGKAGLISGSKIRTVVAYSCFHERDDDPGVTRRLLGMTYWGQHDAGNHNFTGFSRFGEPVEEGGMSAKPFENEAADAVAEALGIKVRSPTTTSELGTTFIVIDPTTEPIELVSAVERNWWPAITEGDFIVSIYGYDGVKLPPRPKRDPVLKTFIDAWEIANERSSPESAKQRLEQIALTRTHLKPELVRGRTLGQLALISDLDDWSYADQRGSDDGVIINHRSLIALVRGPRMVVEYADTGRAPPYVRGVFAAEANAPSGQRSIDDYLRQTEPKAHDAWRSQDTDGDLDPQAATVAGEIMTGIRRRVDAFRRTLKPALPKSEDISLPLFNNLLRKALRGDSYGIPSPTPDVKRINIMPTTELAAVSTGSVFVKGHVIFRLSEHVASESSMVRLFISYRFMEDQRLGDHASMEFDLADAPGFTQTAQGAFEGSLIQGSPIQITFTTEAYEPDWTGRLIVDAKLLDQHYDSEPL